MSKRFVLIFLLLFCCIISTRSQTTTSGLYKTCDDYIFHNAYYTVLSDDKDIKLVIKNVSCKIKIIGKDSCIVINPGVIYGYRKDGFDYRYYKDPKTGEPVFSGYYKILEVEALTIYSMEFKDEEHFYYSVDPCSSINCLSYSDLKSTFADKPNILDVLEKNKDLKRQPEAEFNNRFLINFILKNIK